VPSQPAIVCDAVLLSDQYHRCEKSMPPASKGKNGAEKDKIPVSMRLLAILFASSACAVIGHVRIREEQS
jgi:hypothetical protein